MNTSPIFSIFTLYYLKELKIKLLDSNVSCYNNLYIKKKIYIHLWRKVYNVKDNKHSTFLVSSLFFLVFSKHQISGLSFTSTYQFPEIMRANHQRETIKIKMDRTFSLPPLEFCAILFQYRDSAEEWGKLSWGIFLIYCRDKTYDLF